MIWFDAYDPAGETFGWLYQATNWRITSETSRKITFRAVITEGQWAGRTLIQEWLGHFNPAENTGRISEIRDLVRGDLHLSVEFGTPVRTDHVDVDFAREAREGVRFSGNDFMNVFDGARGEDRLLGRGGDDRLSGRGGDDYIDGGDGVDRMFGSKGDDTYVVDSTRDKVIEPADGGTDTVLARANCHLATGVEFLTLLGQADLSGIGNDLANIITGNDGANRLEGGGGWDMLIGGAGDDRLIGYDAEMHGGSGDDTYVVGARGDKVVERPDEGTDTIEAATSFRMPGNVENLVMLSVYALDATGNGLANLMTGNSGANEIAGKSGADHLFGGRGADRLMGGAGNDVLEGGAESDSLGGGTGKDLFVFGPGAAVSGAGDTILDFESGADRIDLSAVTTDPLTFVGTAAFSGAPGEVRYADGVLAIDLDGGGPDYEIALRGAPPLQADDLLL